MSSITLPLGSTNRHLGRKEELSDVLKAFVKEMRLTVPDFVLDASPATASSLIHQALCTIRDDCKLFAPSSDDPCEIANRIVLPGWASSLSHSTVTVEASSSLSNVVLNLQHTVHYVVAPDVPTFTMHWGRFWVSCFYLSADTSRPASNKRVRK
jgi:hypothetical protein